MFYKTDGFTDSKGDLTNTKKAVIISDRMGVRVMAKGQSVRKQDIVFLNIFFCFVVIFIHASSEIIEKMNHGQTMFWAVLILSRLSGFVVQGFILLSGVKLFFKAGHMRYGKFYLSRLVSIVIPYVIWVVIYYLYFCYRDFYVFSWSELGHFLLFGDISAHFYFIVVLVQFYLLAPLWMLLFRRANPAVVLPVTLIISIMFGMGIGEAAQVIWPELEFSRWDLLFPRYLFYWTTGCMIGLYYREFQNYLREKWIVITAFFILCAALNAWYTVRCIGNGGPWADQMHTLYCISAILFFYMLAQLFTDGGAVFLRPLAGVDRASYSIYLVHCLVIFITNDILDMRGIVSLPQRYGIRLLCAYIGSVVLCLLWQCGKRQIAKIMQKN